MALLSKIFIKSEENDTRSSERKKYGELLGGVGIVLNLLLFVVKLSAGIISGAVSITADAFNNLSAGGTSLLQLIGYRMSAQKPDNKRSFGHGRFEYISGFVISILIIVMGSELLFTSIRRVMSPKVIIYSNTVVLILIISVAVKLYMYHYNKNYAEKLESSVLQATAYDSLTDCVATSIVLLSAMVSEYTHVTIDGYCGIIVALFIIYTGIRTAKDTINPLLGENADPEYVNKIASFVMSYEDVLGVHDLMVHDYGAGRTMISLHAEVSADGDFVKLHDTIDTIERRLREVLGCHAIIHMDPVSVEDEATVRMMRLCSLITKSIDECLTVHNFRMTAGPTHINLIFDVTAPPELKMTDEEVKKKIEDKIASIPGNLSAVVDVDR